jgi:hypothetical protein
MNRYSTVVTLLLHCCYALATLQAMNRYSVANDANHALVLPAVCCLLPAVCCLLPAACCLLSAVCCLLPAACCLLSAVCCLLPAVCCLPPAACCLLPCFGPAFPSCLEYSKQFERDTTSLRLSSNRQTGAILVLSTVCCLLSAVCCLLSAVCCLLSVVCCLLCAGCSPLTDTTAPVQATAYSFIEICVRIVQPPQNSEKAKKRATPSQHHPNTIPTPSQHHPNTIPTPSQHHPNTIPTPF